MRTVVASDRVAASGLSLIEHPGCKAYCIARAENKAVAEAYDWARQTFPVSERSLQAALRLVLCGAVENSRPMGQRRCGITVNAVAPTL